MISPAGYSGTPLIKKLGIKPGMRICILNASPAYSQVLGKLPPGVKLVSRLSKPHTLDFIHFFTMQTRQLELQFAMLKTALTYDGLLWISWPKRASKVETDVSEDVVRRLGLAIGLVDVKVAAIDEVWSGLKLVIRLRDRG